MAPKYPSIPEPTLSPDSLRDAVLTLKQAFEILSGQRGNQDYRAVLLPELVASDNADDAAIATNTTNIAANTTAITDIQTRLTALETAALPVVFAANNPNAAAAGTDVIFSSPFFNIGGGYNASNGRFTAPRAGKYYFRFNQLAPNATAGEYRTAIYKNGAGYSGMRFIATKVINVWQSLIAEGHIDMAVGDFVTVRYESGPAALYTDGNYGAFSGHLIK